MKKKLFNSIGGNKFKMSENIGSRFEYTIQNMSPEDKENPEKVFDALNDFFEEYGQESETIHVAMSILKDFGIDPDLVHEYIQSDPSLHVEPEGS
jgi:hypothetical protein